MGAGWKAFLLEVVPYLPSCRDDRLARREWRLVRAAAAKAASSFDLREAAAGGDGDADDCERSASFEERLHDASEDRFLGRYIGTTKMPLLDAL